MQLIKSFTDQLTYDRVNVTIMSSAFDTKNLSNVQKEPWFQTQYTVEGSHRDMAVMFSFLGLEFVYKFSKELKHALFIMMVEIRIIIIVYFESIHFLYAKLGIFHILSSSLIP